MQSADLIAVLGNMTKAMFARLVRQGHISQLQEVALQRVRPVRPEHSQRLDQALVRPVLPEHSRRVDPALVRPVRAEHSRRADPALVRRATQRGHARDSDIRFQAHRRVNAVDVHHTHMFHRPVHMHARTVQPALMHPLHPLP